MCKEFFVIYFLVALFTQEFLCNDESFPKEIQKCHYGDSECIKEVINDIFANKYEGYHQLLLPSLDPINLHRLSLVQGAESKVNIALHFTDVKLGGLSKAKAYKANGFNEITKMDYVDIRLKIPKFTIDGPYTSNGKILVLPIQGNGISHLALDNVHFLMRFKTRMINKNGKTFLQLDKSKMTFNTTRLAVNFTNLFNGNEQLGGNLNKFMNENWKEILEDLKGTIVDGFGNVFSTIINHVFSNFPYSDMFRS